MKSFDFISSTQETKLKFRSENNRLILKDLFLEESSRMEYVLYTVGREEKDGFKSLYQLYMAEEDPTEFEFAIKYFESYQHWKQISNLAFFIPILSEWREELELKIKARNLKSLIKKAEQDSGVAKYLLGNKWVEDAQSKNPVTNLRGRPSKDEIKQHLRLITMEQKEIEDDYERIKKINDRSN